MDHSRTRECPTSPKNQRGSTTELLAIALGAPAGTAVFGRYGFVAIALATTLLPLGTLLFVVPLKGVPPMARVQTDFMKVKRAVWVPGLASALSSIGFGAITAFSALLFISRGWAAWPAFTVFAIAFILTRIVLGHVADGFGGTKVALICATIEALGLGLIWLAPWSALALVGAALTGVGYSLVYPGFGVEAVRSAPPQSRGLAMGAYTAFLDVALGFGTPALGLLADLAGLSAAFIGSMVAALCAADIAAVVLYTSRSVPSARKSPDARPGLRRRGPFFRSPESEIEQTAIRLEGKLAPASGLGSL